jgi:hypothetical protein
MGAAPVAGTSGVGAVVAVLALSPGAAALEKAGAQRPANARASEMLVNVFIE